jgi:hypothetical protein
MFPSKIIYLEKIIFILRSQELIIKEIVVDQVCISGSTGSSYF